jgi:hypothetical protein
MCNPLAVFVFGPNLDQPSISIFSGLGSVHSMGQGYYFKALEKKAAANDIAFIC